MLYEKEIYKERECEDAGWEGLPFCSEDVDKSDAEHCAPEEACCGVFAELPGGSESFFVCAEEYHGGDADGG